MTLALSPGQRAHLSAIGKLGGLTAAVTVDTTARAKAGQSKFRKGFDYGHECSLCPPISLPDTLSPSERARKAAILYRLHFTRLAQARKR